MPYNSGSGIYTLPTGQGYPWASGNTVASGQFNTILSDLANGMTAVVTDLTVKVGVESAARIAADLKGLSSAVFGITATAYTNTAKMTYDGASSAQTTGGALLDTANSRFTVDVAGLYDIEVNVGSAQVSAGWGGQPALAFLVNGTNVVGTAFLIPTPPSNASGFNFSFHRKWRVHLNVNDHVELWASSVAVINIAIAQFALTKVTQ